MKLQAALGLFLCAATASAQVYKWVDAKGVTHYGDTPPAAGKVERKSFSGAAPAADLPPALIDAMKARPVTLYTTSPCDACDLGRAMLQARGIPHAEKTVNSAADQVALRQAGSVGQLPLLLLGPSKYIGFEADAWTAALTGAGYPTRRMLPPGYQNQPAAPAAPPPSNATSADQAAPPEKLPPVNAPPDFRF